MRIAICDDDKNELEYVYTVICENFKQKNILCESKKYISAISLLEDNEKEPFDAIFLDLDMQEISGMDVASQINKSNEFTEIIFVTNHDELVYKAYRFKALGFVRKKYLQDEIDEIVDLLIKSVNEKQRYIVLSDCDTEKKYHIEDIIFMKSEDHYVDIATRQEHFLIRESLVELEKQYSTYGFIRIHSRYLVNFRHIYSIEKNMIVLDNREQLPMSRNRIKFVKEEFQRYVRRF